MKIIALFFILTTTICGAYAQVQQDSRPKIKEYIDKKIHIVDNFAGQSIMMIKEKRDFYIIREIFGSGIPVKATIKYKVEFSSDYQITFSEIVDNSETEKDKKNLREEFILSVGDNGLDLFLNNLKVQTQ